MTMIVLLWPKLVPDGVTVTGYSNYFGDGGYYYGNGGGDGGSNSFLIHPSTRNFGGGFCPWHNVYYGDYYGDGEGQGVFDGNNT